MTLPAPHNNRRIRMDVLRLLEAKFEVEFHDDHRHMSVKLPGPHGTPYEGGTWRVRVLLPESYPFSSPSVGFETKIFHPNVDPSSGTVCLDVLNQKWTPLYDLRTVFETFLPQLLRQPNPEDPLNHFAALVLLKTPAKYGNIVAKHVRKHARTEYADDSGQSEVLLGDRESDDDGSTSVSDLSSDEACGGIENAES